MSSQFPGFLFQGLLQVSGAGAGQGWDLKFQRGENPLANVCGCLQDPVSCGLFTGDLSSSLAFVQSLSQFLDKWTLPYGVLLHRSQPAGEPPESVC